MNKAAHVKRGIMLGSSTSLTVSECIDSPGFDIEGSTGNTIAVAGHRLGQDSYDTALIRFLSDRRLTGTLSSARWRESDRA